MLEIIARNIWPVFLILLFFGGSIFVHELGHFLAARRRGLIVERFSIGFGPKVFGWKRNGVDYRLSLLPLGGYVALPQLADMSAIEGDTESDQKKLPPLSWSDKIIVSVMGAVFNVIFACFLAGLLWLVGLPTSEEAQTTRVGYVVPEFVLPDETRVPSPAAEAGIKPGDRIISIDGRQVRQWVDIPQNLATGTGRDSQGRPMANFTVEREGELLKIPVYPQLRGEDQDRLRRVGIAPYDTIVVTSLIRDLPAHQAGVMPGDVLTRIDGEEIFSSATLYAHLEANPDKASEYTFLRDGKPYTVTLQPVMRQIRQGEEVPDIGFLAASRRIIIHPNPVQQVTNVVSMTFNVLGALVNPASDIGPQHLSGPAGIARFLHAASVIDWRLTVWVALLININLAILNLLPLPVLDGGHMVFATIEKIRGKRIPPNLVATVQSMFVLLLFSFMIYVSFFDIRRWVRDAGEERSYIEPELVEEPRD